MVHEEEFHFFRKILFENAVQAFLNPISVIIGDDHDRNIWIRGAMVIAYLLDGLCE